MCGRCAFRLSLLLLVWCVCTALEEIQVKTLETGADLSTPACPNQTIHNMTYVICKIDRGKSGGSECQVSLRFGQNGTDSTCDPRVTLQIKSGGVLLHITNIQPSDEGNYTCECVFNGGTDILHLNISVNGSHVTNILSFQRPFNVMIITAFAGFVAVVVLVGIIRRKCLLFFYTAGEHSRKRCTPLRRWSNRTLSPTARSQGETMGFTQLCSCHLTPDLWHH
ncbi:uncharacterized protein LOC118376401 isoform X1 [Oncorhynchus keta]|uniref:uncharacterized protein LOC118376401 isoform X1 n=1 Tax=Oncorhynchus keta TaxID=8018 RepID=UPI0015FA0FCB|nr:uncharacterized protein LOC118376401 isoform X1 [Oncorhynchus keta]